jgi:hypothetical protein
LHLTSFLVIAALLAGADPPQALTMDQPKIIIPPPPSADEVSSSRENQDRMEVIAAEVSFGNEELRDSWHEVARSANGSVWYIRGKDLGAWTPAKRLIWVKIDHSRDNIIRGKISLELRHVDCATKRDGTKLSSMYDMDGKQTGRYIRPGSEQLGETFPASPGRAVVDAFCPSTRKQD